MKSRKINPLHTLLLSFFFYVTLPELISHTKQSSENELVNQIIDSFGLDNRVFAECGSSGDASCSISAPDICIAEQSTGEGTATAVADGGSYTYPVRISLDDVAELTIEDLIGTYNNYPDSAPEGTEITHTFNITTPSVAVNADPGDSSGPYSGLGRTYFDIEATSFFDDFQVGSWELNLQEWGTDTITLAVDHANQAPDHSSSSSNYSATISEGSSVDVPVNVTFTDVEENDLTVTFELSDDNFSSILQTESYTGISSGESVEHTFDDLSEGSYNWRARAEETDAIGTCEGYDTEEAGINLSTIGPLREIVLNSESTSEEKDLCPFDAPGPPKNLAATTGPGDTQYTLTWDEPDGEVSDYSIAYSDDLSEQKWGIIGIGNVESYTISDLQHNSEYHFWVYAVNECMPGPSALVSTVLPKSGTNSVYLYLFIGMWFIATALVARKILSSPFNFFPSTLDKK